MSRWPKREAEAVDPYVRYIRRFFARWAPYYDLFAGSIYWVYRAAERTIGPRPGMTVLDLCTGTGEIGRRCAGAGADVTGVDLSPEMLARARRKLEARGLAARLDLADARRLAFEDGSFDVVVIGFGLHDMPRRARLEVLAEARRVARHRLVVVDYDLPPERPGSSLWRRLLGLVESPYFPGFVATGASQLLREAGFGEIRERRLFPAFVVIQVAS